MRKYKETPYVDAQVQQAYINGLKQYEAKGIPVFIDGKRPMETDWGKIFEVREDESFYMSDFVGIEEGTLREIHFDRVYNK